MTKFVPELSEYLEMKYDELISACGIFDEKYIHFAVRGYKSRILFWKSIDFRRARRKYQKITISSIETLNNLYNELSDIGVF